MGSDRWLRSTVPLASLACALALPVTVRAQSGPATPEAATFAQEHFVRARELYTAGRIAEALAEARASHAVLASPNSRLYIARCLRDLGRTAEALAEYEAVERDAGARFATDPRYAATRDAARNERDALRAQITATPAPAPAPERGAPASTTPPSLRVRPATPARPTDVSTAPPDAGRRAGAWVALAVGAVGVAGVPVFWALTDAKYRALSTRCDQMPALCTDDAGAATGRLLQALIYVSAGLAAAGVGVGAVLLATSRPSRPRSVASARVVLGIDRVGVEGSF